MLSPSKVIVGVALALALNTVATSVDPLPNLDLAVVDGQTYLGDGPSVDPQAGVCFPALGFVPPVGVPTKTPANWWCLDSNEAGFFGFSYDIGACQSKATLTADFTRMRTKFRSRFVRLYSACDNVGFMDNVISAAYGAGIGVYALIWFGFDGTSEWKGRRDALIKTVKTNKLAPYVIKSIDVGSEPLYDWVLTPTDLAAQVVYVKAQVKPYGIKVGISEMQYGYTVQGDSSAVLKAIDYVHAHQLPFFDQKATNGAAAWSSVLTSTKWFLQKTNGTKKIIFSQTGWPTNTNTWPANSPKAVASVASSQQYATLLDQKCEELKALVGGDGVGWFWQIWKDAQLDGWGLLDWNENPKFNFAPRTAC